IAVDGKRDSSSGEAAMGGFSIQVSMSNLTAGPGAPKVEPGASPAPPVTPVSGHGQLTVTITKVRVGRTARTATVAFRSSEPGTTFTCKLDRRKRRPCTSPATYRRLSPGLHSFEVSGVSAAGNAGAAAAERFRVPAPKHRHR
ncbi:MAG TPA: hypothetical protein VHA54_08385, partial [Solirubrobacterales bacterium]|nr:hypothetical protein [Solirubrobacterales bacterium]